MLEHTSIFTNNQWKTGSGSFFTSTNPANGEVLWQGHEATQDDVNEVVANAIQAFEGWAALSIDERSRYLSDFSEILYNSQQALAEVIAKETGKPLWDALGEVDSMVNKLGLSLEAYGRRCAGMIRDQPLARSITRHRPHGVVSVFGPYNFPGHLPNGHIIPALLAGNTVIFKPSEFTPLVAETILSYWQKASLPVGVINLVQGGHQTGHALIHHEAMQGLFFTGSYQTGCYLSQLFGAHPSKILALEMGGNNPLVIGEINDLQAAAYLTLQSTYLTSGQRCTCARRLLIPQTKQGDAFLHTLIEMIHTISVGSYEQFPEPFMGPVITETHAKRLLAAQMHLQAQGGQILVEMQHLKPGTGFLSPGLMDATPIKERPDEEIFGPFLQVIRVENFKQAIEEANHTKFGLAAGLLSQKQEEYTYFYRHIQAGIINWNTPLTGASSAAPFGGIKCSGNHRPSAYYAADYCSYPVASFETAQLKLPPFLSPGIRLIPRETDFLRNSLDVEK